MKHQLELSFEDRQSEALAIWREQRRSAHSTLASKLGLPVDHQVELWLRGGIRLRGKLTLKENMLIIPEEGNPDMAFEVEGIAFKIEEMEVASESIDFHVAIQELGV